MIKNPNNLTQKIRLFDIAANLADSQFKGEYFGKQYHDSDIDLVFERCQENNVDKLLIVGGYIEDTLECEPLIARSPNYWTTVGVHPCRASEVFKNGGTVQDYYTRMDELIARLGVSCSSIGECGLDYDRLEHSSKEE